MISLEVDVQVDGGVWGRSGIRIESGEFGVLQAERVVVLVLRMMAIRS